jgi:hypothetical protein
MSPLQGHRSSVLIQLSTSVNVVCSWLLVSTRMSSSLSPLLPISCPKPCMLSVSLTCPASYRSISSRERWTMVWSCSSSQLFVWRHLQVHQLELLCPTLPIGGQRTMAMKIVNTCRLSRGPAGCRGTADGGARPGEALAAGHRLRRACCHLCLFVRLQPWWESPCIPAWSLLCNTVTGFCAYTYLSKW